MNSLLASILGYVNGFFALMIIAASVTVGFSLDNELGRFAPWVGLLIGLLIATVFCGYIAIMVSMRNELVHIRRILNNTNRMNNTINKEEPKFSGELESEKNPQSYPKPHESYWDNGKLREKGTYKDGEKEGVWEKYDESGQLDRKETYKNGNIINFEKF